MHFVSVCSVIGSAPDLGSGDCKFKPCHADWRSIVARVWSYGDTSYRDTRQLEMGIRVCLMSSESHTILLPIYPLPFLLFS